MFGAKYSAKRMTESSEALGVPTSQTNSTFLRERRVQGVLLRGENEREGSSEA